MATEPDLYRASSGWTMRISGWLLFVYFSAVVYGSLVPFELRPHTLLEAWNQFLHIRYLDLGVVSRADWIANILLYIPLGFLVVGWLQSSPVRVRFKWRYALIAFVLCSLVACMIEFIQIFFAPRTVSINDLIAENLGSFIGIALWINARQLLSASLRQLRVGGHRAILALLILYAVVYVVLGLFPFDFIFSLQELQWKLSTDHYGWLVAGSACQDLLRCLLKFIAEVLAAVPLGVLLVMYRPDPPGSLISRALTGGLALGLILEACQFLTASGVAQGMSVASRGIGVTAGAWLMMHGNAYRLHITPGIARTLLFIGVVPYVVIVLAAHGWFTTDRVPVKEGLQSLRLEMFLPFYFHYFSTEANAVRSLIANFGLYFPVGLAYWMNCSLVRSIPGRGWVPVTGAALLAFVTEAGKLFLATRHPDPTNVLIAAVAAGIAWRVALWVQVQAGHSPAKETIAEEPQQVSVATASASIPVPAPTPALLLPRLVAVILFVILALAVTTYPLQPLVLGLGLVAYAAFLWKRPALWLFCLPALLPLMNFAPWTGWLFVDEFDLIVLATVAINLWKWGPKRGSVPLPGTLKLLTALMVTVLLIGLAIGLLPLQVIDVNSFAHYYSSYNALRVGKGMLWALMLLPLIIRALEDPERASNHFMLGMLTGLAGVIAVTLWERWTFPGLLNFSSEFRTAAMFSEMHTGGAYIDAYLAAALPFIAACFLVWRNSASYLWGIFLFGLGLYAFLVTFSRTNYLALAVSVVIVFIGLVRSELSERRFYAVTITLAVVMALVLIPVLQAPYIKTRFATVSEDLTTRLDHWEEALDIRSQDMQTSVFGMGLGSYPRALYIYSLGEGMPQTYEYIADGANTFLRLGAGTPLYMLQKVKIKNTGDHHIAASIRSGKKTAKVVALLCEKTLLYSLKCESTTIRSDFNDGQWTDVQAVINASELGQAKGHPARSVSFGIYNLQNNSFVDIDNIRLIDPAGLNLVKNGDFSHGQARWYFTVDDHLSWHIKNMWIHLLFEQGWPGLVLVMVLVIYLLKRLGSAALSGSPQSLIMLSSLSGLLVIGVNDSLFDAPRLTLLFWMLAFFSIIYLSATEGSSGRKDLPSAG